MVGGGSGSLAFASLGLGQERLAKLRGKRRQAHPTCAHDKDLEALFREIDVNSQGYLDVHSLRVGSHSSRTPSVSVVGSWLPGRTFSPGVQGTQHECTMECTRCLLSSPRPSKAKNAALSAGGCR